MHRKIHALVQVNNVVEPTEHEFSYFRKCLKNSLSKNFYSTKI
jgi:hypothetical protein